MSKSMFKWTQDGVVEVAHRGDKVQIAVPEWMQGDLVNSPTEFLDQIRGVIDDRTVVHRILSQLIIDLRAAVKPGDSDEKPERISEQTANSISRGWTPPAINVPKESKPEKTPEEQLKEAKDMLKAKGWTDEQISAFIDKNS